MWLLVVKRDGETFWRRLPPGQTKVGRGSDNDLIIVGRGVSRHHALFRLERGILTVRDLDSTYGTRVSGSLIREKVVEVGDPIDIGVFRIVPLPDSVRAPTAVSEQRVEETGLMAQETGEYTLPGFRGHRVVMGPVSEQVGGESWEEGSDTGILAPARGVELVDEWRNEALARVLRRRPVGTDADWEYRALAFLQDIARRAALAREAASTLRRIVRGLSDLLRCELAVILEVTGEEKYQPLAVHRVGTDDEEAPLSRTVLNRAVQERSAVISQNLSVDPDFKGVDSVHLGKAGALVAMPMLVGEEVVGVLYLSREAGAVFSDEELQLAEVTAALAAGVIRIHHLVRELRDQRRVGVALERVADPEVRDRVLKGERLLGLRQVETCVLALHVADTSLLGRTPGDVSALLTDVYGALDDATSRNGGRIVSFGTSWALALFGIPQAARTDATWAVAAALDLAAYLDTTVATRWGSGFQVGLGMDFGPALWGVVGWPGRAQQAAMGPAVARAMAVARQRLGQGVVVTEETLNLIPSPGFSAEPAGQVGECRVFRLRAL